MDGSVEPPQNGARKASFPRRKSRAEPKDGEGVRISNNPAGELGFLNYVDAEEEDEEEEYDPCFGFDSDEEDEGEEEEEEMPEFPPMQTSSINAGFITEPTKKYRRHHFIKHEICFPDKQRKYGGAPKGKPWYLNKKKGILERRQDSRIAFNMPRQEDPEVLALRKTNKMIQKLIKYMKKSWKVRIDRKQSERELEHRTLASVYTKKADEWMETIRAREDRALHTGFFSPMDLPYDALIDLELDTALLTFKNLPPDLKITAGRWIRAKLRKEELKRKRDANLPRLPHGRVKRPSYNKGRLIKDPGGVARVDAFAKAAEGFVKVTRGNTPFSKVLKEWSQKKEKESYSSNSGFGVVREGMFDFSKGHRHLSGANKGNDENFQGSSSERRVSIIDARKYQRDMLYYEKMLGAMYDIVKSLLNIKTKQLESKFPLPPSAVLQIRGKSPDRSASKNKGTPLLVLQRQANRASRASVVGFGHKSFSHRISTEDDDPLHLQSHGKDLKGKTIPGQSLRKSITEWSEGDEVRRTSIHTLTQRLSRTGISPDMKVEDIVNPPPRSSRQFVSDIKKQHAYEDFMDVKSRRQTMLTAEQKIKRLAENPDHAAIRRARNYMTYNKLFERNRKIKRPVWHNIDITQLATEIGKTNGLTGKDPANLTETDAAEVVDLALKRRQSMDKRRTGEEGVNKRWPEEYDIPTPTYQFTESNIKISSEEQSRQNLLKKSPHVDEVPSTPVRRLFKLAGVRTTNKDTLNNILEMKKMFRLTENKLRVYYENEVGKLDWDTVKRFRGKLSGVKSTPVYQWTIGLMRLHHEQEGREALSSAKKSVAYIVDLDDDGDGDIQKKMKQKRPALWFKKLQEECEQNGATRHNGCHTELQKLLRYCDVDMKTKPHMLNRLALFVVSLPTTELGTMHWQQAVVFLLEYMCGTPPEMFQVWLKYRGVPYLL